MKNNILYYSVGALLYCPACRKSIADSIIHEDFGTNFSLALCLEDTINDNFVEEAEKALLGSIQQIYESFQSRQFYLPKIFIRVRSPRQITKLTKAFGPSAEIITGYIIPKFSTENANTYIQAIIQANELGAHPFYMMPIYESSCIVNIKERADILYRLKDSLSAIEELVLNIRVGGNDLCHLFGFRRHADESIHRIRPIADIFSDIITVYGMDYVVSGPVWEYYSGVNWKEGLLSEIADDKLCGFTGKTVIHPQQIPVLNRAYQVSRSDFDDARSIINWDMNCQTLVSGSPAKERMNEYKTHQNWAQKILFLAEVFGVKD